MVTHDLTGFDANLLVVLDLLFRERSVSRTAQSLDLTQSAVSHALKRLRKTFGDPLLVRKGNGMALTGAAELLEPRVREAVRSMHQVFEADPGFAPSRAKGSLKVGASALGWACWAPALGERLARQAPAVRLMARAAPSSADRTAWGRLDVSLGPKPPRRGFEVVASIQQRWFRARPPWADELPEFDGAPRAPDGMPQIRIIDLEGGRPVDAWLEQSGQKRIICATTPSIEAWRLLPIQAEAVIPEALVFRLQSEGWRVAEEPMGAVTRVHACLQVPARPVAMWFMAPLMS